jgi:hypothetical protein
MTEGSRSGIVMWIGALSPETERGEPPPGGSAWIVSTRLSRPRAGSLSSEGAS